MTKTNAARRLERLGIRYEIRTYDVDLDDLGAENVARKVGMELASVWKTLVVRTPRSPAFAVVPADGSLDLKALARALGERRAEIVALRDVQPLTGYVRGGVTALAAKKAYPVVADTRITTRPQIAVSAGIRGAQLIVDPKDYVRATSATLAAIVLASARDDDGGDADDCGDTEPR